MTKRVAVLGSTGSVGTQTLDVLERLGLPSSEPSYRVCALAAGHFSDTFSDQVRRWRPEVAAVCAYEGAPRFIDETPVWSGPDALGRIIEERDPDIVLLATPGLVSLGACLKALARGRTVAIANKEILVSAGELIIRTANQGGGTVVPVDSEHSGIWQCLRGEDTSRVVNVILTSSGGAFRDTPQSALAEATPEQALRHPTWSMGPKITVDSATLMNKGLEIIEARWLFDIPPAMVTPVLHRQSIVHAMVEFIDGSIKAQLSLPDMRLPIVNALTYPDRVSADLPRLDVERLGALTFEPIDNDRYPSVNLARAAGQSGGTYPAVLNAANEVAVARFLRREINFLDIIPMVAETLGRHRERESNVQDVYEADAWARRECAGLRSYSRS